MRGRRDPSCRPPSGGRIWPLALVAGLVLGSLLGVLTWRDYRAERLLPIEQAQVIRLVPDPPGLRCPFGRPAEPRETWFFVADPARGQSPFFSDRSCRSRPWRKVGDQVAVMRVPAGPVHYGPPTTLGDVALVFGSLSAGGFLVVIAAERFRRALTRRRR